MNALYQLKTFRSVVGLALLLIVVSIGCTRTETQITLTEGTGTDQSPADEAWLDLDELEPGSPLAANPNDAKKMRVPSKPGPGDWPMFRGDAQGSGVATTSLPPTEQLEVLWEYKVKSRDGAFEASPIVVRRQSDDRPTVYAADLDGKVYSIDLETGDLNWEFQAGISIEASPAYKDGRIYIGDIDGRFYCLDENGGQVWSKDMVAPIMGAANFYGDNVVFGTDDANLYCLDCKNGAELWKFAAADQIQCSITISDATAFVAGCDGHFRLVDLNDGTERGSVPMGSPTGCTPAVANGFAVVGTEQAEFVCIDLENTKLKWGFADEDGASPIRGAAAITGKQVIFGSRNRQVYSVSLDTGKQDWTVTLKGRVDGSPIVVGDRIFVGASDGRLYALSLDGDILWKKQLKGPINNTPAPAFGKLVIATDRGVVYCLGKKKDAQP